VSELARHVAIDAYVNLCESACGRRRWPPFKLATISRYNHTARVFEKPLRRDYVTENSSTAGCGSCRFIWERRILKRFRALANHCYLMCTAVSPIPAGSPTVIQSLAADESRVSQYFAWRKKPLRAGVQRCCSTPHWLVSVIAKLGENAAFARMMWRVLNPRCTAYRRREVHIPIPSLGHVVGRKISFLV